MFCTKCGKEVSNEAKFCPYCGTNLQENFNMNMPKINSQGRNNIIAGLLNILLPFGTGRFYAGYMTIGAVQLIVSLLTLGIGSLWSVIDGILILTNNPNVDGYGNPWTE